MMPGEITHLSPATLHVPPWYFNTSDNACYYDTVSPTATENNKDDDLSVDVHTCDQFRMFHFKVRDCARARAHDWTECPFAHPGEKARRRDPKKVHYSATACPDFRKAGSCLKADACQFAHGVFECWLHPARYRTQPCKDGMNCTRRVCFFAHAPDQLRVVSSHAGSVCSSSDSPPASPVMRNSASENPPASPVMRKSVSELVASLRQLQLDKVKYCMLMNRPGYWSLPNTPTQALNRVGAGYFDQWENCVFEEEPVMERVESGRDLRAKMFEKLSKENPLDRVDPSSDPDPEVSWVSELVE